MANHTQALKLVLLGIPVLILMLASIALTGYLAVDLISQGLREGQVSPLILGSLLAATWILMFYKTAKARLAPATGQ